MANELALKYGPLSNYRGITTPDPLTLYFTPEGYLYKGEEQISTVKFVTSKPVLTGTPAKFAESIKSENVYIVTEGNDAGAYYAKKNGAGVADSLTTIATRILNSVADIKSDIIVKDKAIASYSAASDNKLVTEKAVAYAISQAVAVSDAMVFKGTLGTSGTVTSLPNNHRSGDTYRVVTAGSYAGQTCEIGDLVICIESGTTANNAHWTVAQTNIDGAITNITSSTLSVSGGVTRTINLNNSGVTANSGGTTYYNNIKVDQYGRVTEGTSVSYLTAHPTVSVSADETETANNLIVNDAGNTLTVIKSFTKDSNGHVTKVTNSNISLKHMTVARSDSQATGVTLTNGGSFTIPTTITTSASGHVTAVESTKFTLPAAYSHPSYTVANPTSTGTVSSTVNTFTVVSDVTVNTLGHVTSVEKKTFTVNDLGSIKWESI